MSFILFAARASFLLLAALSAAALMRRAPASARRLVLALGLFAVLVMPLLSALVPDAPSAQLLPLAVSADAFAEPPSRAPAERHMPATTAAERAPERFAAEQLLLLVWAVGGVLVLARTASAYARAQRLKHAGERVEHDVLVTPQVDVPMVVGVLSPEVLLPRAALGWSVARRTAVLLHERAHLSQRDPLVQCWAQLACAVYWFLPFSWMAARRLRRESELSADERVVSAGVPPTDYAEHLLAIAQSMLSGAPAPAAALSMGSELEQRVRALLAPAAHAWSRPRLAAVWCGACASTLLLACMQVAHTGKLAQPENARLDGRAAAVQAMVNEEAARAEQHWEADGVVVVVLDPRDGALLARYGDADVARMPGSTVKPFTVAAALESGAITPEQRFDCGQGGERAYGDRTMYDAASHGPLDARETLGASSNVCTSQIYDALGGERLLHMLRRVHFGSSPGSLPAHLADGSIDGALVASGVGMFATPLQLARAYAALNDGVYRAPAGAGQERVLSEGTARTVRTMLEETVYGTLGTGKAAAVPGTRVAGKTGTTEILSKAGVKSTYASFAGLVPAAAPRLVVYVGIAAPRGGAVAGASAAPLFARIAERALSL